MEFGDRLKIAHVRVDPPHRPGWLASGRRKRESIPVSLSLLRGEEPWRMWTGPPPPRPRRLAMSSLSLGEPLGPLGRHLVVSLAVIDILLRYAVDQRVVCEASGN